MGSRDAKRSKNGECPPVLPGPVQAREGHEERQRCGAEPDPAGGGQARAERRSCHSREEEGRPLQDRQARQLGEILVLHELSIAMHRLAARAVAHRRKCFMAVLCWTRLRQPPRYRLRSTRFAQKQRRPQHAERRDHEGRAQREQSELANGDNAAITSRCRRTRPWNTADSFWPA